MLLKKNIKLENEIISKSRIVNNFPKDGIKFIDISPLFESVELYNKMIEELSNNILKTEANKILGIESRGFLLASPLSLKSKLPLILARKAGKVPFKPIKQEYGLEYGKSALEISESQIQRGDKIVIVDDILATGGTIEACVKIIQKLGGNVACIAVLGDLPNVGYDKILSKYNVPVISLAQFI